MSPACGAVGHGDGDGAVELDDGGWSELSELGVEGDDAGPVGFGGVRARAWQAAISAWRR